MRVGNPTYGAGKYDMGCGMVSDLLFILSSTKIVDSAL